GAGAGGGEGGVVGAPGVVAAVGGPGGGGFSAFGPGAGPPPAAAPAKISKVALIGVCPSGDGEAYFDSLPVQDGAVPSPGWAEFEGPDSADLDGAAKQAIASAAIPVPEGVTRGVIRLADKRRHDVPVVLICPEFTPAQAREWIEQGEVPELATSKEVWYIDIDSVRWPMISAPDEFARLLAQTAEEP